MRRVVFSVGLSLLLHLIESSYYLDNFLQMKLTWPVNIRRTHTLYIVHLLLRHGDRFPVDDNQCHSVEIFFQPIATGTDYKNLSISIIFYLYPPVGSTYSRSDVSSDHDAIPENCLRLYNKRVHVVSCDSLISIFSCSAFSGSLV